jgi:glutamate/tyrosine decarboxylase-like PLP-dependent enzyme
MRAAFGLDTSYLIADRDGPGDPHDTTPELSRRARGVPVWAALSMLGRDGVTRLVDGLTRRARQLADGVRAVPGAEVLNDVVFTQVSVAFGDDARTREVTARLLAEGAVWMSGSRWQGRDVLRISVSNWSTDDADVEQSLAALRRAAGADRRAGELTRAGYETAAGPHEPRST